MTVPAYTGTAVAALAVVCVMDLALVRTRLLVRRAFWTSYAIVLAFQLVVDGVLAGLPVVRYQPQAIIGVRLFYAPVEDLVFGFCLVLATLSVWVWIGRLAAARTIQDLTSPSTPTRIRRDRRTASRRENTS
jgi:lycopene cyclase domain-containing protein